VKLLLELKRACKILKDHLDYKGKKDPNLSVDENRYFHESLRELHEVFKEFKHKVDEQEAIFNSRILMQYDKR